MRMRFLALAALLAGCTGVSSDPGVGEVVAQSRMPMNLALGGDELYFVDAAAGPDYRLMRTAKLPGSTPELVSNNNVIAAIASDSHGVYWLGQDNAITKAYAWSPGDAAPRDLGTNPNWANGTTLRNIVSDGANIYYADMTGTVWKIPETGTGFVELGKTDTSAGAVTVAPDGIWVATLHGAELFRTDGTTTYRDFLTELSSSLVFDDDTLFVAMSGSGAADGSIQSFSLATETFGVVAQRLELPSELIAVKGMLYFVTGNSDGAVREVPYGGGQASPVASGNRPASVVVDDSYVYWSDPAPQYREIRRTPR